MRKRLQLAGLIVFAMILAACGGGDDASGGDTDVAAASSLEELIAAAQEEGSLVYYVAPSGFDAEPVEGFEEKYGITVEATRLPSTDLAPRYSAEIDADAPTADVVVTTVDGFVADARDQGWMVGLDEANIPGFPWEFPENFVQEGQVIVQLRPWGIAWNTDLVAANEAPEAFEDLLDERWQGQILHPDPESSKGYQDLYNHLWEELGDDFIQGLVAQDLVFYDSGAPMLEALAAGEGAIGGVVSGAQVLDAQERGAPLEMTYPDLTVANVVEVGLTADEHNNHPNAARLFVHWLMSEEGSQVASEAVGVPSLYEPEVSEYVLPEEYSEERAEEIITTLRGS